MISSLVTVLIVLAVVGTLLYLFNRFVTMDGRFKSAINAIVCLIAFIYILTALFGRGPL